MIITITIIVAAAAARRSDLFAAVFDTAAGRQSKA